ncbi:membrane protein DedA with SNARE-associated domain [Kaistia hirudinis]|uniref:Membrane protein DedA with SNARE-associated domain n=1 Tax=Kaistia hirudinis TaxID=1293440 RepID=A0A840AQ65_9HYPH|nr:DedA family protein [Kaistia hirudinis]MBB3932419.1 membrane protein DedA with SNARE-associated domain [Kaistia hirudinis]
MSGWIHLVVGFVGHHADWAMALVFLTAMAESLAIVGLFIPGTAILVGVGSIAGLGGLGLWPVVLSAILGAIVGDGISYWLGHTYKDHIRTFWPFDRRPGLLLSGEAYFRSHGAKSVFLGRFVPAVRAIVPLVAGITGMKPGRFYIANVLSALAWGPAHILPGAAIGLSLDAFGWPSGPLVWTVLGVTIALMLFGWLYWWSHSRRGSG